MPAFTGSSSSSLPAAPCARLIASPTGVSLNQLLRSASKAWHGVKLHQPDWSPQSHSLALSAEIPEENVSFYFIFNAFWESLDFELPAAGPTGGYDWRRWIDTSLESPCDIQDWPAAPIVTGRTYRAGPRSVVVLIAGMVPKPISTP